MKAITVIERDDGGITIAVTGIETGTDEGIRLLHSGIEAMASPLRWVLGNVADE